MLHSFVSIMYLVDFQLHLAESELELKMNSIETHFDEVNFNH